MNAVNEDEHGEVSFSRKDTPSDKGEVDKGNYADKLNAALVAYGLGKDWENAYEEAKLPDTLSGVRDAVQAAFGRDIRAVAPTAERFDIFNGVHTGGEVYVNVKSDVGFVQVAGHELYHHIEKNRPDLIEWYRERARDYYKNISAYHNKIERPRSARRVHELQRARQGRQ